MLKTCSKSCFLFCNTLFWVSGCVILGVSMYLKFCNSGCKFTNMAAPRTDLLIAVGLIVMAIGVLGYCGATGESKWTLLLFFFGLVLIFNILLVAGILKNGWTNKSIKEEMEKLLPLDRQPQEVQMEVQALEEEGTCCGLINGHTDWGTSSPSSCNCSDTSKPCELFGGRSLYKTPCIQFVSSSMRKHLPTIMRIAAVIIVVMIFGMSFVMIISCQTAK